MLKSYPPMSCMLLAALLSFGCSASARAEDPAEVEEPKPIEVTIAGSQWFGHFPAWLGIERGHFARHGIVATWEHIGDSSDRIAQVASGEVHFASVGEYALLKAMVDGEERIEWVGAQDISPGFEGILALAPLSTMDDLRGKCIGYPIDSSAELTMRMLLEKNGLDPARDVRLDPGKYAQVVEQFRCSMREGDHSCAASEEAALAPGEEQQARAKAQPEKLVAEEACAKLDAAVFWDPDFTRLKEIDGVNVIATDLETPIYEKMKMMTGPDVLILSRAWREENPEQASTLLRAYFSIVDYIKEGIEKEDVYSIHGSYVFDQSVTSLLDTLRSIRWLGTEDQAQVLSDDGFFAHMDAMITYMVDRGLLDHRPDYRKWIPE